MNEKNINELILDINEANFAEEVIEKSKEILILVDFWAPWCGPCKTLTPILEKIVKNGNGKLKLIKVNIEENQQIASQLRIQSIPAVYAFKDGNPINAFQGAIPENKIIEFIEKSLGEKIAKDHSEFYESINRLNEENNYEDILSELENFMIENPEEFKAKALYIDFLTNLKKYQEVDNFFESIDDKTKKNEIIISAYNKFSIKKENIEGPSIKTLEENFKKDNKNIELLIKLSDKYFAENEYDQCFNLLLKNYTKNKEMIKIKFIKFFEALGHEHAKTREYRKKFSSIMFS